MLSRSRSYLVLFLLPFASNSTLFAASEHFPNRENCTGPNTCNVGPGEPAEAPANDMDLTIVEAGGLIHNIKTATTSNTIDLVGGNTGEEVAVKAYNALCKAAFTTLGAPACTDVNSIPASCATPADCCIASVGGGTKNLRCTNEGKAFDLTYVAFDPTAVGVAGVTATPAVIRNINCHTEVGNAHGPDLLPRVLVQVRPNGVDGTVTVRVTHNQGGQNPRTFAVSTGSFGDTTSLHNAFRDGFNNLGLGLIAETRTAAEAATYSWSFETLAGASFVRILNADTQQIIRVEVDGVQGPSGTGQIVTTETNTDPPPPPPIPTLSPWGMGIVVLMLLLSGLWVLRRRQDAQHV